MSSFSSPLRYPGGKNCIFKFVSNLLYENDLIGINYAEPYAGGAGLALRLLFEEYVNHIYINDYDLSIYSFWDSVLNNTQALCDWISDVELDMETWHHFKEIQTNKTKHDQFELAKSTFFLNRTNVSGIIKGGVIGGYEQKGKYKLNARFKKDELIKRIEKISRFKHRIKLSNSDGINFIKKIDKKNNETFIYLDPPYYQKGADLYMNYYVEEDHQKLCQHVKTMNKKWMVSYDNHEFILNLYAEKKKVCYQLSQSASNRVGNEVLIFSDAIKFSDSITHLHSPKLIIENTI